MSPNYESTTAMVLWVVGAYVLVGIPLIILTVYAITRAYHAGREAGWMRFLRRLQRRKKE